MSKLKELGKDLDAKIKAKEAQRKAEEERIKARNARIWDPFVSIGSMMILGGICGIGLGVVVGFCKAFVSPKSELFNILLQTTLNFGFKGAIIGALGALIILLMGLME